MFVIPGRASKECSHH